MNNSERLQLNKIIQNNDVEDMTSEIRKKCHSDKIKQDVLKMIELKKKYPRLAVSNREQFNSILEKQCTFLYSNYTDIFNRVVKDELNMEIMTQLLMILKMIEDKKVDQHEGSVVVGKLLKQLYVDSSLKRGENLDSENAAITEAPEEGKKISWKDFKNMKKTV